MAGNRAVDSFQEWLLGTYRADGRYEQVEIVPAEGDSLLGARLHLGKRSYYEVRLTEGGRELQVGFATESRTINEEIEEEILTGGGSLDELLGDELCDLGQEPLPMAHWFERPAFRFACRIPIGGPEELESPEARERVRAILKASEILFQSAVDEG